MLIGITVILATVIATVVFGIGVAQSDAPQATLSFSVTDDGSTVYLIHEGGDELQAGEVVVRDENGSTIHELDRDVVTGERVVIVDLDQTSVERLSVVYVDPGSESQEILATFRP